MPEPFVKLSAWPPLSSEGPSAIPGHHMNPLIPAFQARQDPVVRNLRITEIWMDNLVHHGFLSPAITFVMAESASAFGGRRLKLLSPATSL